MGINGFTNHAGEYDDGGEEFQHYVNTWIMRTIGWFCLLYVGDDVIGWWWSFMRFVVPDCAPQ